ncbi:MAG: ABC transporter permease subunit [Pseudomonadota bacterium]
MLGPVAAGLAGTLAPAFGWLPPLGGDAFSLAPWHDLLATPGLGTSVRLSLVTGLAATALSLALTLLICAAFQGSRLFRLIERALSPLLSVPHAAAAFGLAFLIAPSGWIARAVSPWATGWERPPDLLTTNDPAGLALIAGLVAKEVPFLLLMTLAALAQADARRMRLAGLTLGYGPVAAWLAGVLPRIYPQIRLPVYAVLAYSMSVVDVAMILGPTTPPPLSVRLVEWMRDPDLTLWFRAAAGAVLQIGLVAGALLLWRAGELAVARLGRRWLEAGYRPRGEGALRILAGAAAALIALSVALGLAAMALWSVAGLWRFPDALPDGLSLRVWMRQGSSLADPILSTLGIAAVTALAALALTVACLEAEHRHGRQPTSRSLWLLYAPLLVPQTGFLFGLQIAAAAGDVTPGPAAVAAAHLVFVLPYVFLSLSGPYRAWDTRQATVAHSLGAGPDRVLWAVRLPMLLGPLLTAFAVGFAVSVGQYLPTLLIGAGRVETLTTEAVSLAAGGDRRLIGLYAILQMAAPLPAFMLAIALPALLWRRRRAMTVAQ